MEAGSEGRKTGRPVRIAGEKPTRERIFDAAIDLFSNRGFDRTSVRDIAHAAGITESAVYRHYAGKDSILAAIFEYTTTRVYTPLPEPPGREAGSPEPSVFRSMLEGLPSYLMADPRLVKIIHILFMEMHHNDRIRDFMKTGYGERADVYTAAIFRQQMDEGRIVPCDPHALARIFNGFRFAWLFQTFILSDRGAISAKKMEMDLEEAIVFFEQFLAVKRD